MYTGEAACPLGLKSTKTMTTEVQEEKATRNTAVWRVATMMPGTDMFRLAPGEGMRQPEAAAAAEQLAADLDEGTIVVAVRLGRAYSAVQAVSVREVEVEA